MYQDRKRERIHYHYYVLCLLYYYNYMREMIKKNETEITFITQLNAKNINKKQKKNSIGHKRLINQYENKKQSKKLDFNLSSLTCAQLYISSYIVLLIDLV